MQRTRPKLAKHLVQQPAALLIVGLLIAGILHGLIEILALALAHWQEPTLFGDSFAFVQRDGAESLLGWLTAQHNEHRIVWAKAASLVETELLKIPPGQSALIQNLALILGCAGLWCWLCKRLLHRADLQLITGLAGWLLLLNPWQYENLGWEFQTPWFLINALVLLSALLLTVPTGDASRLSKLQSSCALLLPWIALSSTGQGLAVALALVICSWLHSRRLGVLGSGSTTLAIACFFVLLPYSKPAGHPEMMFHLEYFLKAWLGGPWQGLAWLCVVITAVLLGRRRTIARQHWPAVLMPALFSLLFAAMITLSRAGFGLEQANSSRYISHSLLLGLSALLTLALADEQSQNQRTPLLGGFLVLLTTLGAFPQMLQAGGLSYTGTWSEGQRWAEQKRERFICNAQRAALTTHGIHLLNTCEDVHPDRNTVDGYLRGTSAVQPRGWHRELLKPASSISTETIVYQVDQQVLNDTTLQIRGWAFAQTDPDQRLYLLADYGTAQPQALLINQPRRDVKRAHKLPIKTVGFDVSLPRAHQGKSLRAVRVGTPNQSLQIWQDHSADG
jgi:hypothetical protein